MQKNHFLLLKKWKNTGSAQLCPCQIASKQVHSNRRPRTTTRNETSREPFGSAHQGCQVWNFRGPPKNLTIIKLVGLEIFENLLNGWPIFKSIEVCIVKSKIFPLLKQFGIFLCLQAPGNPACSPHPPDL